MTMRKNIYIDMDTAKISESFSDVMTYIGMDTAKISESFSDVMTYRHEYS